MLASSVGVTSAILGPEARVVPALHDREAGAVPVEAAVVEAAGRAAVRVASAIDRRGLEEIAPGQEESELVSLELAQRDRPALPSLPEHDPRDVAGRAAAEDRRGQVRSTVAGE